MTTTESKGSPFLSIFHRKKKINGTKSNDDIKQAITMINDAQPSISSSEKERDREERERREKERKARKTSKKVDSNTLPVNLERKKKGRGKAAWNTKSQSLDDLFEEDPKALLEALETIADEQPMVARSIPKHAKIMKKQDTSMNNCLFEQEVYDSMLCDSLRVCDLLQSHLDDCIVSVRAKSPEPCLDTSHDGHDSGRGASSASSTISSSPGIGKRQLKSCVTADV